MNRRITFVLATLTPFANALATAEGEPTAAQIVERARAAERWIHEVDSLYLRAESTWTKDDEAIEARREYLRRYYGDDPVPDDRRDLQPETHSTLEWAFDSWRFYSAVAYLDFAGLRIWNGEMAMQASGPSLREWRSVAISDHPSLAGRMILPEFSWLRADAHTFWFSDPRFRSGSALRPDQFDIVGRDQCREVECYVLEANGGFLRWYVGVEDGLLRGLEQRVFKQNVDTIPLIAPIAATRGVKVRTWEDWRNWMLLLPPDEREILNDKYYAAVYPVSRVRSRHFLDNYKEIAPGRPLPRTQGYVTFEENAQGGLYVSTRREMRIVEVKVDEPLDDALFTIEIPEGARVTDRRFDPLIVVYPAKADRTDEEFEAILEKARQDHADRVADERNLHELVGKPAPPFPAEAQWLNGEALNWRDLQGKVVVLTFFANWCGPCRATYPEAARFFERRDEHGVVLIGVHTPGATETVKRFIDTMRLEYPVIIDVPAAPGKSYWGEFYAGCRVQGIPHAMVIDAEGSVAASGMFGEMVNKAMRLRPPRE